MTIYTSNIWKADTKAQSPPQGSRVGSTLLPYIYVFFVCLFLFLFLALQLLFIASCLVIDTNNTFDCKLLI